MHCIFKIVLFWISFGLSSLLVHCGDVTIDYSPPSERFGSADSLHLSDFDDLLAFALGYTPNSVSSWPGLTVTSAFNYPFAAVVFGVRDAGVSVKMEGTSYELKEDIPLAESYNSLTSLIGARARRAVHFDKINALDLVKKFPQIVSVPKTESLDEKKPVVNLFLQQMSVLPSLADYLEDSSSMPDGGQDIIFVDIDTFAPVVKEYGPDSPKVKEASKILRESLVQTIDRLRGFYKDRVVVATAMLTQEDTHVRKVRSASFEEPTNKTKSYNLARMYRDDFPVVFNIVVILAIILVVTLIAVSVAMAFMDPGRDSIIYRMTNPRMKKDQ